MDTRETRVPLPGVAKIFEAGLKSKTWDIYGMPQFITTTHCEGCDMCEAYTLHVVEVSKVPTVEILSREVEKAFWITWLNIVCHIEDEASSESDKKVEWYSNHHDNLTDNVRMAENKASVEWDHHQKADEKLAQANSKITELEAKLAELQQELVWCIYAPYKVNPNIFQFYFDFPDIFHHTSMHPLFHNIYEFYLIFYDFISLSIIYNNRDYLYLRQHFLFWFRLAPDFLILSHTLCPELKSRPCMRS